MKEKELDTILELENMAYQFEIIDRLIHIIRDNYYNKNEVDYNKFEDYHDLCVTYKDVSTLLETIQNIARDSQTKFYDLLSTKKDIKCD